MLAAVLHALSAIAAPPVAGAALALAQFDNPFMLAGLGGAVVPLVIHLLGRARYRSLEWGAMMFVDAAAAPRFRDPGRFREWALLGVRMAAVGLLAVALARPVLDRAGATAAGAGEPRVAAAIVVDCSASMGYADVGGPRIEQARRAVLQILSTMKRGDRVALFASAPAARPGELSGDLQAVAARANDLKPVAGQTDLAATIEAAADLLGRQERVSRQLYVITDRQASNFRGVTDEFADRWRAHAPLARFTVIPVGGGERDNLAVEWIAVTNPPAVARCPGEVQVRVRNYGSEPCAGVALTLRLADREVFATTLNVPPRDAVTTTAAITFAAAGAQELSAELRGGGGGAGPPLDDRRVVVVDVAQPLPTLLVRGRRDPASADVVRAALAPPATGSAAVGAVAAVDEVLARDWDARGLEAYRVVVLDAVDAPDAAQVAALEQFVYGGGGLLIAPGPSARTNDYNRLMYREEGALLPALLQPPLAPPLPVAIDRGGADTAHPLMHFLAGQDDLPLAHVSRFIATTARTPDARIVASFSSGDAFVLEAPFGRGRVVLMTSSLRPDWSTLPLTPLYLPLLQSALRYAAGADLRDRNFATGTEIVARFEPEVSATRGTVIRPDRSVDRCELISAEGRTEARYAATALAGVYTVRAGTRAADPSVKFALAPPDEESDLAPLDEATWQRLQEQLGFTRLEPVGRSLAARLIGTRAGGGGERYWLLALGGVLGLFVIELALTRAWAAPRAAELGAKGARR